MGLSAPRSGQTGCPTGWPTGNREWTSAKAPAFAHESAKIQPSSATTVATSTEGVMNQSVLAYLLGPLVMAVVGVVLWAVAHYHHDDHQGERRERWLDTHPVDWMRHRH
jgi:hypothetical protein